MLGEQLFTVPAQLTLRRFSAEHGICTVIAAFLLSKIDSSATRRPMEKVYSTHFTATVIRWTLFVGRQILIVPEAGIVK